MHYLVVDIGSGSGKLYLAELTQEKVFSMKEVDRFPMERAFLGGHLVTNIFWIYDRICAAIRRLAASGIEIDAMGIDSWCGDYGIVDVDSGAVTMPVFYRDSYTDGYTEKVAQVMDYQKIYQLTTQREITSSTLCQLLAYKDQYPKGLEGNKKILFLGDMLMYFFTGKLWSEISVASYSQLFSMRKEDWEKEIFASFGIPESICPPVVYPGTVLGKVTKPLQEFLGTRELTVVTPAVHDTSSAAAAVPAREGETYAFLATGSWFLMSMAIAKPADVEKSYNYQLSNTGLIFKEVLLKKNITAMWLVQECKRQWKREGQDYTDEELARMAEEAEALWAVIDTEYEGFFHPPEMVTEITNYLKRTGQKVPDASDAGQIVRVIYESIVMKSKEALEMLEDTTGQCVDVLYVIGGANRIRQINQFLADATGLPVRVGPSEASAMGNALLQAYGMKQITSAKELRSIARNSCQVVEYVPGEQNMWQKQFQRYHKFLQMQKEI